MFPPEHRSFQQRDLRQWVNYTSGLNMYSWGKIGIGVGIETGIGIGKERIKQAQ